MYCPFCGINIDDNSRFCEHCGNVVEVAFKAAAAAQPVYEPVIVPVVIPEPVYEPEPEPEPVVIHEPIIIHEPVIIYEPEPEPVPIQSTQAPPEGFTYDPNSGLYYILTYAPNPETGESGQWVTWFYPHNGEFKQVFTPDQITQQTPQLIYAEQPKKKISLFSIIVPSAGLLAGVLIAVVRHIVFS